MKKILGDIKAIIAELAGMVGGFFWARSVGWDYEPLILLVISTLCFIVSISLLRAKSSSEINVTITKDENLVKEKAMNGGFSRETPRSIMEKIDQVPLFQQDEIAKNFIGLRIKWHLKLFSIYRRSDAQIAITMQSLDRMYPRIGFNIEIVEYPIFKTAADNKEFIIIGEIIDCTRHDISIKISELFEV